MARPRTPVGTFGTIKTTELAPKLWEARTRYRLPSGRFWRPRARGSSATAAVNALKEKLTKRVNSSVGAINGDTRMARLADLWLSEIERKVSKGTRAPKTLYDYRDTVNNEVKPRVGELAANEFTVTAADAAIKGVHDDTGYASAKKLKTVLNGICGYGLRNGATFAGGESINPVRLVEPVEQGTRKAVVVLEPHQRKDFLTKLRLHVAAKASETQLGPRGRAWTDLPDIAEAMLSTGVRLGEACAVVGEDIDEAAGTVYVGFHLVRVEKVGMVRMEGRKGGEPPLTLRLPTWSVPMWRRRKHAALPGGPVFPSWNDRWVDPSNVGKRFRAACDKIGYDWVASHVFRRTVGTHLGDADVQAAGIGDQLGNSERVVERHYRRKRVANAATAQVLESMMDDPNGGP